MHLSDLIQPVADLRQLAALIQDAGHRADAEGCLDQIEANLVGMHERLQAREARGPRRRNVHHFHPPLGSPAAYDDADGRHA